MDRSGRVGLARDLVLEEIRALDRVEPVAVQLHGRGIWQLVQELIGQAPTVLVDLEVMDDDGRIVREWILCLDLLTDALDVDGLTFESPAAVFLVLLALGFVTTAVAKLDEVTGPECCAQQQGPEDDSVWHVHSLMAIGGLTPVSPRDEVPDA